MSPNYPGQYLDETEPAASTEQLKRTQVRKSLKVGGALAVLAGIIYYLWNLWRK